MKKLTRSRGDRWLSGVLGGFAEYAGIDPTVVRLVFILLLLVTGVFPFVILYGLAVLIVPQAPRITPSAPAPDAPAVDADRPV